MFDIKRKALGIPVCDSSAASSVIVLRRMRSGGSQGASARLWTRLPSALCRCTQ